MKNGLEIIFAAAKRAYPAPYVSRYAPDYDMETGRDIEIPHTWSLVDAVTASFYTPERQGMLLLQEHRPGCKTPFNHWGFMVAKADFAGVGGN